MRFACAAILRRVALAVVAMALFLGAPGRAVADWRVAADLLAATIVSNVAKVTASPEAFRRATDADDTDAIQAALDTGHSVQLAGNRTYVIGRPLVMRSNQRLAGGGPSTVLKARQGWVRPPPPDRNGFTLIINAGYLGAQRSDGDLLVEHLTIDASAIERANGAFHGIGFRMARRVMVRDVHCISIGDCTAFENVDGSIVADSSAVGVTNVGFDHWEGPRNAVVRDSRVRTLPSGAGVMFTGGAGTWTQSPGRDGGNLVVANVTVEGRMLAGIVANILAADSSLAGLSILDSRIDGQGQPGSGIVITGNISDVEISGNTVENLVDGMAIGIRGDRWGLPRNVRISRTRIVNASVGDKGVAPIILLGSGHRIESLEVAGGSYPFAVWTSDAGLALPPGLPTGSRGRSLIRAWQPSECRGTRVDC